MTQSPREDTHPAPTEPLTDAELRVLQLVRDEHPNAEIAERLGVSTNTVRYHISNMLAKLHLENRYDLAAWDGTPATEVAPPSPRAHRAGLPLLGWLTGNAGTAVAASVTVVFLVAAAILILPRVTEDSSAGLAPPAPTSGLFEEMLRLAPDTYRHGVVIGDLARYRELTDVERWQPDVESQREYVNRLWQLDTDVPFPGLFFLGAGPDDEQFIENMLTSFGISVADTEQWLLPAYEPPRDLGAVRGRFDPDQAATLLAQCDACEQPEVVDHQGRVYWRWGEDLAMDLTRRGSLPAFDQLGRGGRLAVFDEYVLRAVWDEGIELMLDAHVGVNSLIDDEDARLAARGMDRLSALAMLLTDRTQGPELAAELAAENWPSPDAWEVQDGETLLLPYELFAIGPGWNERPYTAITLVHASVEAAEENARRLPDRVAVTRFIVSGPDDEETWGDVIDDIEIEVDGRVLRATLWGHASVVGGPWSNFLLLDPLLRHE